MTWGDREVIMLSQNARERQIPYDLIYMLNLKTSNPTQIQLHKYRKHIGSFQKSCEIWMIEIHEGGEVQLKL